MSKQEQHFEDQKAGEPASSGSPQKRPSAFAGKGGARERDEECPEGRSESERTLPRRVSRETSEPEIGAPTKPFSGFVGRGGARERAELSPQAEAEPSGLCPDEITPEQQMLYDIIDRSMAKSQERQAGENTEDPAPPQEEPEQEQQDAPPPPQKNKPSSFYVYLAVLFGAAFLMLLLAYFVQQRNNATAMDDLRMTSTASRQELLEQIQELEEKRDWLQNAYDLQRERNDRVDEQNAAMQAQLNDLVKDLNQITNRYDNAYTLNCLERFIRDRDYLMAATIVAQQDAQFNRNAPYSSKVLEYLTPANEKRYLELKEELFRKSDILTLAQEGDGSGYAPGWPIFALDASTMEERDAALSLWFVVRDYAISPDWSAQVLVTHYDRLRELGDQKLFKPSTMELLEEIKEDLISQELVTEENGMLTANVTLDESEDDIWEPLESDPE